MGVVGEKRGQRVNVPPRQEPLAATVATAVGHQYLVIANPWTNNIKPWREGGGDRPFLMWAFMPAFLWDKNNELVQGFATGYSVSEDGRSYTFHLNPEAVFQDGTPVTADAYKWALEYGLRPKDQVSWGASTLDLKLVEGADKAIAGEGEDVTGLVVIDDNTLEFNITTPTATFPHRMSTWLQGLYKAEGAEADPVAFWENPIGVGPYKFTSVKLNERFELEATDNWWAEKPVIQDVTVIDVPDAQTELIMFENGEVDFTFAYPGRHSQVYLREHPLNQYLVGIPVAGISNYIRFDTAREPFKDINVRRALTHAVDMDAIILAVMGEAGVPSTGVLQNRHECFDPKFEGYNYAPEKARLYLARSKYKTGANVPLAQIQVRPGNVERNLILQAVQESWQVNLGVELKINMIERGQESPTDINMRIGGSQSYIPDPGAFLELMAHSGSSVAMHVDDELDAKIDSVNALGMADPDRCRLMREANEDFSNGYYMMLVDAVENNFLVQPWVIGLETSANLDIGTLPFIKIGKRTH